MGRKKKKAMKPWCWYCNREFDEEKVLIYHQKAKHFKCHVCHKKLYTGPGLAIHCLQVHKEPISAIPNALPDKGDPEIEIYGIEGIPIKDVKEREQMLKRKKENGEDDDDGEDSSKKQKTDAMPMMPVPMPGMPMMPGMIPPFPGMPAMPAMPAMPGMPPMHVPGMPMFPGMPPMLPPGSVASPLVPGAAPIMMFPASSAPMSTSQPVLSSAVSTPGLPRPLFPAAAAQASANAVTSTGPVGADFKPLSATSSSESLPSQSGAKSSTSAVTNQTPASSKPGTVPLVSATSRIIHPEEDISLEELRARTLKYNYKTLKTTGETTATQPEATPEPSNPPPVSMMNAMPPQPMIPAPVMAPPPGMPVMPGMPLPGMPLMQPPGQFQPPVSVPFQPPSSNSYQPPSSNSYQPPSSNAFQPPSSNAFQPPNTSTGFAPPHISRPPSGPSGQPPGPPGQHGGPNSGPPPHQRPPPESVNQDTSQWLSNLLGPPVIYVSAAAPPNFGKNLRSQDVAAFERLLTDDVSCGKTPLILIAYAGTPVTGHTDNLSRLREICTQSGVWLHVEGDSLATLSLPKIPPSISAATSADSFTIDLPSWLGAVNIPHCAEQSGLVPKDILDKLTCLPLWALIKAVGIDDLKSVIVQASELAQQLSHRLDMVSGIKRLEQSNVISPTVIFKYKASPTLSYSSSNSLEDDAEEEDSPAHGSRPALAPKTSVDVSPKLCDAFNKALTERLQKSCGKVQIRLAQISREGSCMSFNPLRGARANGTGNNDIDEFVEELEKEILKMDSTLISRTFFEDAFQSVPDVVLVDISDEPAVGAFQCIPKYWKVKDMSNLSDSKKKEANDLNRGLLQRLSEEFEYLAEGKTASGQVVIKIGLIDDSFDVNILAERVKELAEELEDNSKFLESLSDAIQKSIHQAEEVLQKESEEKFYEEGILRHVPVLGSVFSWLSPPAKESHGITGRAFTLASGKLESTEKTYRYKMQLENGEGSEEPPTETAAQPHDITSPSEVEGHPVPPQEQQPVPEPITEPPSQTEAESSTLQAENATENEATAQEIEATPVEDKDKSITENAESTKSDVNSSKNSEVGEEVRESDV
eukprot:Seg2548.1 transcript_id=Seg2548.1/GoldUCD/mRNA.D3Y31 product="Pyridoxal-dependent decarboxylase domain-containing protein 1" protein_id=Seg2548.1/GoldUCD/D3Y31